MKLKTLLALGLPAAALSTLTGELYRHVFCREGSPLLSPLMNGKSHKPDYYAHRDGDAEKLRRLPCRRFELRSGRGALLRGFYTTKPTAAGASTSSAATMRPTGRARAASSASPPLKTATVCVGSTFCAGTSARTCRSCSTASPWGPARC